MSNMTRTLLRTTIAAFAIVACTVLTQTAAFAQFDIDSYSPVAASGNDDGEYPYTITIEYSDGTMQDVSIAGNGITSFEEPNGNNDLVPPPRTIVAWWFGGQRYLIPFRICIPWRNGCLCFCVKCVWQWPFWFRCRWAIYYDPCCP